MLPGIICYPFSIHFVYCVVVFSLLLLRNGGSGTFSLERGAVGDHGFGLGAFNRKVFYYKQFYASLWF